MLRKISFAIVCFLISATVAFAQNTQVSGVVLSSEDNLPVIGASVVAEGTTLGTVTDFDGRFSLDVPSTVSKLMVSYVGFQTQEVSAAKNLKIVLFPDTEALEEVLVVAYGTATKGTFTGSAGVVDTEALEKRQVSNVTNALSGAVAGVQVQSANGQPGTSAKVRVRGVGSINAGMDPLYIVDGIPYDGDIAAISSQDIASMTVLKDAASTAMYGSRGANGVIMITTKQGRSGKSKISFDAKYGMNSRMVENYDVMTSTSQYIETLYRANYNQALGLQAAALADDDPENDNFDPHIWANNELFSENENGGMGYQIYTLPDGQQLIGTNGLINPKATLGYSDGEYYYTPDNWADEMFSSNPRQEYNLNISGGSNDMTYYASVGYLEDSGIITGSGFKRLSTRLKADYQAKSWLKVGANMGYTNAATDYPTEQTSTASSANAFRMANYIAPVYPLYVRDAEGNLLKKQGRQVYDYGDGQSTNFSRTYMSISNPAGDLLYNHETNIADIFNANAFADITLAEGLVATARYGLNLDYTRSSALGNAYFGQSAAYGGTISQETARYYGFNQQYMLNYRKTFADKHNVDVLAGYDGYEYKTEYVSAYGTNLYDPESPFVSNAIDQLMGYGSASGYSTEGYIARANYNYNDTYFLTGSYRRDASSRFHPDNRWGNFFSASAAWILTNESFMSSTSGWLNLLKLKASIGQQGNDKIGNYYAYRDQFTVSGSDGVFSDGTLYYKGNPDLTWETSTAYNVGVDFALFDSRLSGSLEYFGRQSSDMLYNLPVAPSLGYSSLPINVGSMRNTGVELDVNYALIDTKNIDLNINFNATSVQNEIIELHEDLGGEFVNGTTIYTEGESMYRLNLVKYAGVNDETGKAEYWAKDAQGVEVLTSDYTQASSTNKVGTADLMPDVYGGLGATLRLYGFDASIQMAYQLGGQIYDSGYKMLMHSGYMGGGTNWHLDILDAWTTENKTSDIPALNSGDQYASTTSDRWLVSSDYLALNNITIGYTLPKSLLRKAHIESLRFYVVGDNLSLLTARKGLDPRQSYTSATTAVYTPIRTVSGGVSLTF